MEIFDCERTCLKNVRLLACSIESNNCKNTENSGNSAQSAPVHDDAPRPDSQRVISRHIFRTINDFVQDTLPTLALTQYGIAYTHNQLSAIAVPPAANSHYVVEMQQQQTTYIINFMPGLAKKFPRKANRFANRRSSLWLTSFQSDFLKHANCTLIMCSGGLEHFQTWRTPGCSLCSPHHQPHCSHNC